MPTASLSRLPWTSTNSAYHTTTTRPSLLKASKIYRKNRNKTNKRFGISKVGRSSSTKNEKKKKKHVKPTRNQSIHAKTHDMRQHFQLNQRKKNYQPTNKDNFNYLKNRQNSKSKHIKTLVVNVPSPGKHTDRADIPPAPSAPIRIPKPPQQNAGTTATTPSTV